MVFIMVFMMSTESEDIDLYLKSATVEYQVMVMGRRLTAKHSFFCVFTDGLHQVLHHTPQQYI